MKRRFKALLGWIAFHSGLYQRFFRNRAVIVLFHRVDDRHRGKPLTCTPAEFAAFLRFFRRFFCVVPLKELLARLRDGESLSGHLTITFDDGYLDNHRSAAPELRRYELPACFFVATELIASERVTPWDADQGISSEWMNWDHVRSLRAQGFEIGSHTMNHVDLGIVAGEEALHEIIGSKHRLERELSSPVPFFAYPFGHKDQITEENRKLVEEAGYTCCLSSYGGSVVLGDAPFHLKRTPVSSWHISPYQFGFETMLEKN